MTAKQLKYFGPKKAKAKPRRKTHRNPASIITLGLVNPERKQKTMAKRRRKSNTTHTAKRTTRKANPTRRKAGARRKNGTRIYIRRNSRKRRNPEVFGMRGGDTGKAILAGLVGVYATKTISPMIARAVPGISGSPIISALLSAAIAVGGGMFLKKWDARAGEGFMFGGLMQAGSQALNLFVSPNPLSLSGLGDFQPARFAVPQNPITAGSPGVAPGMGAAMMFQ